MALAYSDEPSNLPSSTVGWAANQAATTSTERSGRTSIGMERTRLTDECPIAQSAFPRPVIQANYPRRRRVWQRMLANQAQDGIATAEETQLCSHLSPGLTSQSEPQVAERFLQADAPLSVGMTQLGQPWSRTSFERRCDPGRKSDVPTGSDEQDAHWMEGHGACVYSDFGLAKRGFHTKGMRQLGKWYVPQE